MKSEKFELNKNDVLGWLRNVIIIFSPVIILFLTQIENNTIDFNMVYALFASITIDLIRRYVKDYKKELIESVEEEDIETLERYMKQNKYI